MKRDMQVSHPREDYIEQVIDIIQQIRPGIVEIGPDTALADLNFDSMQRLELLARVEQQLDVELTEDLIAEFKTPSAVAHIVRELSRKA